MSKDKSLGNVYADVHSKLDSLNDVEIERVNNAKTLLQSMTGVTDANALYQICFQLLKLGGLEAEIPRLVVFGQQSMGKTTLLDFVMGCPIGYSSTTTATTHPVVIMLKPSDNKPNNDQPQCRLNKQTIDIKDLQEAMKTIMTSTKTISAEELELEISLPNGVHAVFVDLPGIKFDSKKDAELTKNVVRTYVRNNPNDFYVLVKKASDDPANWPYSLKDFILKKESRGLGLSPEQTIVVSTRAKEFLNNVKGDVRTQMELLEKVQSLAIKDTTGVDFPLHLLELYSLSVDDKARLDFSAKKAAMYDQILANRNECLDLLNSFEPSKTPGEREALMKYFGIDSFKKELNAKFQALLSRQLSALHRRLVKKRGAVDKAASDLEKELAEQRPQSTREYIKLFLRELLNIIKELLTGDYEILRLPDSGNQFLDNFAGNLSDNLESGHLLCQELFPKHQYDPDFLRRITAQAESALNPSMQEREALRLAAFPVDPTAMWRTNEKPQPDMSGRLQPGQFVRLTSTQDYSQMLGHVHSMEQNATDKATGERMQR